MPIIKTNKTSTRPLTEEERSRFEAAETQEIKIIEDGGDYTLSDLKREGHWILSTGPFAGCFDTGLSST